MYHRLFVTDLNGDRIDNSEDIYETESIYSSSIRGPIEENKNKKGVSFTMTQGSRNIYQYLVNS